MSKKIGFIYDDIYLEHTTSPFHPESPARLKVILSHLEKQNWKDQILRYKPKKAEVEEILLVHTAEHIKKIDSLCQRGGARLFDGTDFGSNSYEVALWAAGGAISAVEKVISDELDIGFAAVRPPGHHSNRYKAAGFCLFNNIAIAAKYAQKELGIKRILIVDWDLHHGNGTQDIFYDDPSLLYFSTHQYPFYPGSGHYSEIGEGKGLGFTINVPLPAGTGDKGYIQVFKEILIPIAEQFEPELVMISAGYDSHFADPIGGMLVTQEGFAKMAEIAQALDNKFSEGGVVLLLEGGYGKGLAPSVSATLAELGNFEVAREEISILKGLAQERVDRIVTVVQKVHQDYWRF
jgi:acetoin utilization deacetylase AcuC-like enzyme